jgi:AraC-like DNA-binding protein
VRFGAPEDRFILPIEHLDQPLPSANPVLLEVFEQHARAALPAVGAEDSRADQVARVLAICHLANPATSAGQVGFLLGFSEPSAFHRAFRRWTGKPPSAFRPAQPA